MVRTLLAAALLTATAQAIDRATMEAVVRGATDIFAAQYFDLALSASVSTEIERRLESGHYSTVKSKLESPDVVEIQ